MIIMGIDASTKSTGYSVYDGNALINYGLVRSCDKDALTRINVVYDGMREVINKYRPDYIFIENVPLSSAVNKLVAEHLLVLQGTIYTLAINVGAKFVTMQPSNWRRLAGVVANSRKREDQKIAAVEMVANRYGYDAKWIDKKYDEKTGVSDWCEAILIGSAGLKYLEG